MYTLYIDESGEAGVENVRDGKKGGASPYLVLGAYLIKDEHEDSVLATLEGLEAEFGKVLHCNRLKHIQKVHFAKQVSQLDIVCFSIISKKATLDNYKDKIKNDGKLFYNKCCQYLFECFGEYLKNSKISSDKVDIIFEEGNFDYRALKSFITRIQENPLGYPKQIERLKLIRHIDADRIGHMKKDDQPLLKIADLIAHSVYKLVDRNDKNFNIIEPRYLFEISPTLYRSEKGQVINYGIKPINTLAELRLDREQLEYLRSL